MATNTTYSEDETRLADRIVDKMEFIGGDVTRARIACDIARAVLRVAPSGDVARRAMCREVYEAAASLVARARDLQSSFSYSQDYTLPVWRSIVQQVQRWGQPVLDAHSVVEQKLDAIRQAPPDGDGTVDAFVEPAMSLVEELRTLMEERPVRITPGGLVTVTTPPLTLVYDPDDEHEDEEEPEGEHRVEVEFPPFDISFRLSIMGDQFAHTGRQFYAVDVAKGEEVNWSHAGEYWHPHISRDGELCTGGVGSDDMAGDALSFALKNFQLCSFVDTLVALLGTYNTHSPHCSLVDGWGPRPSCAGCGEVLSSGGGIHPANAAVDDQSTRLCIRCTIRIRDDRRSHRTPIGMSEMLVSKTWADENGVVHCVDCGFRDLVDDTPEDSYVCIGCEARRLRAAKRQAGEPVSSGELKHFTEYFNSLESPDW